VNYSFKLLKKIVLVLLMFCRQMVFHEHCESIYFSLQDDKKFYQLELVNRETNFNKIFNTNPNVGVINPLVKVGFLFRTLLCPCVWSW